MYTVLLYYCKAVLECKKKESDLLNLPFKQFVSKIFSNNRTSKNVKKKEEKKKERKEKKKN